MATSSSRSGRSRTIGFPSEGSEPVLLHQIEPSLASPFQPAPLAAPIDYGAGDAEHLGGFRFSSGEGSALWAVSGARKPRVR